MDATETQTVPTTVEQAIANFTADDLWSPKKINPLFKLDSQYVVNLAIDSRRFQESRRIAFERLSRDISVQSYTTEDYNEFGAFIDSVPQLLKEYDDIRNSSEYVRDPETIDFTTEPEQQMLLRFGELKNVLQKQGVIIERWEKLIDILTDFDLALRTISMNNSPVSSAQNELLGPIARYLAAPEIQSSYVTRFLALIFLSRLQKEIEPWVKPVKALIAKGIWIILSLLLLIKLAGDWIITVATSPIGLFLLIALGIVGYAVSICLREDRILKHLIAQFEYCHDVSKIDGRFLKRDLEELSKLGMAIPSLLFSLFDITLPGY